MMNASQNMTFRAFVENFYGVERPVGERGMLQYRDTVRLFVQFVGREITLDELDENLASRWVAWLESEDYAAETIKQKRRMLLTLWRYAADLDVAREPRSRRVRKIRKPPPIVYAWTLDEIARLLAAVDVVFDPTRQPQPRNCLGYGNRWSLTIAAYRGIDPRLFWKAFIRVAFDSGARLGDVLAIRPQDIDLDGVLVIRQQKTGRPVVCQLSPDTLAAVAATFDGPPKVAEREFLFPWAANWRQKFHVRFRELVRAAGIRKGTTKYLRRSRATYGERDQPGLARRLLGHASADTWLRYVDVRVAYGAPPQAPTIPEPPKQLPPSLEGDAKGGGQ